MKLFVDFLVIFIPNQLKELFQFKVFSLLICVLLISLISNGVSRGAERYLRNRMDSPFVNYFECNIPYEMAYTKDVDTVFEKLQSTQIKEQFSIDKVEYLSYQAPFFLNADNNLVRSKIRPLKDDDLLRESILNEDNIVFDKNLDDTYKWGLIVTKDFLVKNYKNLQIDFLNLDYQINKISYKVPLAISAIVNQLPNGCDICVSSVLFDALKMSSLSNPLDLTNENHGLYISYFIPSQDNIPDNSNIFNQFNVFDFGDGKVIELENRDSLGQYLFENEFDALRVYDYDRVSLSPSSESFEDILMIKTKSLDSLDGLKLFLSNNLLDMDMNQLESKKNYTIFKNISDIINYFLSTLSIITIITIIFRIITEHIKLNSKNIGTLMAFGLSSRRIVFAYSLIGGIIAFSSLFCAYFLALLIGPSVGSFLSQAYDIPLAIGDSLFVVPDLVNVLFSFILIPIFLTTMAIYLKLHKETPGNLIYER